MTTEWIDPVSRREFLRLMGASLALAGMNACTRQPRETIVPYQRQPEEIVPGKSLRFATAFVLGGFATGVLVESHEGRPTKIEGNPDHPASLGATDVFAQASVLTLYDPERSQVVTHLGQIRTWSSLVDILRLAVTAQREKRGAGLRILTETVTSPTLARQIRALLEQFPQAKWSQWEPVSRDSVRQGVRLALGEDVSVRYRLDRAEVVLALDSDFLTAEPGSLRYARDFAARRRKGIEGAAMDRLYAVESTPSCTGAIADHRLRLRARDVEAFTRTVASRLGLRVSLAGAEPFDERWIAALVRDLRTHRGSSLVVAGIGQPPAVHVLAHAMNHTLGNAGETILYADPVEVRPVDQARSLAELAQDIDSGAVDLLVILGGNPAFTAPADLDLPRRLLEVPLRVRLGLYEDETSQLCQWHVPEAHPLESWSDARAYDGTASILQPLIAPLYDGKSAHELLSVLLGETDRSAYEVVRETWKDRAPGDFERFWRKSLHDGVIAGTELSPRRVSLRADWEAAVAVPASSAQVSPDTRSPSLEIVFRPDPTIHDGCFANNGWLQELPKPLTKLTWDNAAIVSPATARRFGLENEEVIELASRGRSVRAPVWIQPGHADDSLTVHLGYGRTRSGRVGTGAGFNPYALRTTEAPWFDDGLEIRKTGERHALATTQTHHSMEGRDLVRSATLAEARRNPEFARELGETPSRELSLFREFPYDGYAWGMVIDLAACVGCGVCELACQAENNIPIVGKSEVLRGREMHWLRIDRYYAGDVEDPETRHQPVPCMHCENAPCEVVCPVGATVHSDEGLNDMVYNRCVGTRYCSNNCPYKVRRFNYYLYSDWQTPSLTLLRNPNVTVRSRGVMEKCTYCVQRISAARIEARKEDRKIRDGEVVTACQAACPTEAIVFGDLNDPGSRVAKLRADPRNYGLLAELNTRPRTTYLAHRWNPNPELERSSHGGGPAEEPEGNA